MYKKKYIGYENTSYIIVKSITGFKFRRIETEKEEWEEFDFPEDFVFSNLKGKSNQIALSEGVITNSLFLSRIPSHFWKIEPMRIERDTKIYNRMDKS